MPVLGMYISKVYVFAGEAELVFCPYNYLIDPVIRKSMSIDIRDAVLIFDEAHNIEDISRLAASLLACICLACL